MTEILFIGLKSYRDDGKFVENETDKELEKSVSLAINKIADEKGL